MRRLELDLSYASTRAALLFLLPLFISDVGLYENYAHHLTPGHLWPYLHWDFEYPPLAYPLMWLPSALHDALGFRTTESYRVFFGLFLLPFDFLLYLSFRRRPPFRGAAFYYVLLSSSLGLLLFDRFDIALGFLIAWPFLRKSGPSTAACAAHWGLGGALKLIPVILFPLPALFWTGTLRERARLAWRYGSGAAAPILLSIGAAAWLAGGRVSFLSHHTQRGVQIESLLASIVFLAQSFFHFLPVTVDTNFGAQHLGNLPGIVTASRVLFYGALLASYGALYWRRAVYDLLSASWLVLSAFVTFGYVLSPQYLFWLLPLGLCAAARVNEVRRPAWLLLFSLIMVITGVHFRFYWDYVNLNRLSAVALVVRNGLLVLLWGLSWSSMAATPAPRGEAPSPNSA